MADTASANKKGSAIAPAIVNPCQKGNPLLKHIKNVPWEFGETLADFEVGKRNCILFLSLKYHKLHPNYIYERLRILGKNYLGRYLLCLLDTKDHAKVIRELTRVSVLLDFTLILAWGLEEAGRYIETFKAYETKSSDSIRERKGETDVERITQSLINIKSVNKTDAATLMATFDTVADIINAGKTDLQVCPGFGPQKIRRILEAFDQPFKRES